MRVLIAGSTGLVGGHLVHFLLEDSRIKEIHSLVRKETGLSHSKLKEHKIVFENLQHEAPNEHFDAIFCCLGTTIKKAGSQEKFRKVDFDYVKSLAENYTSADQFLVVSAMGADKSSSIFYNRVKGEMEEAVKNSGIKSVQIFRPSLLLGDREEFRLGEKIGSIFMRIFSPLMFGSLKKYRPIKAADVAKAMLKASVSNSSSDTFDSYQIQQMASGN
ncbi:NAD(P)H-binding protein [Halocola ammonii]